MIKLSIEQKDVCQKIIKNVGTKEYLCLGGYAGTGKTTIIQHIRQALPRFAVCAFTGKAANILRKKNISDASTIHSLIYEAKEIDGKIHFELAESLPFDGIIVDEASMVSSMLYNDLLYFKKPIIFVGDHGQLEPVGEDVYLMKDPDYRLETIHRNAGEIAHFAEFVRKGFRAAAFEFRNPKKIEFVKQRDVAFNKSLPVDQIICAFNKTRVEINRSYRDAMEIKSDWPIVGDRIICLRNNRKTGLFNGQQGIVNAIDKKPKNNLTFETDDFLIQTKFDPKAFHKEKRDSDYNRDDPDPFDYAYAITCHKAQGDEFDNVMVLEQKCNGWDHRRWTYTAASRAREKLIWVT